MAMSATSHGVEKRLLAEIDRLKAVGEAALLRARQDWISAYEGENVTGFVARIDSARKALRSGGVNDAREKST
jgi:hypothetical protein